MTAATATAPRRLSPGSEDATTTMVDVSLVSPANTRSVEPHEARPFADPYVAHIVAGPTGEMVQIVVKEYPVGARPTTEYVFQIDGGADPAFSSWVESSVATEVPGTGLLLGSAKLSFNWPEPTKPRSFRTELGKRLWAIREQIIASGLPPLDWDGVEREVQQRRGEHS